MFSSHRISQDIPLLEQVVVYYDYSFRNQSQIAQYPARFLLNNATTSPENTYVSYDKVGIIIKKNTMCRIIIRYELYLFWMYSTYMQHSIFQICWPCYNYGMYIRVQNSKLILTIKEESSNSCFIEHMFVCVLHWMILYCLRAIAPYSFF